VNLIPLKLTLFRYVNVFFDKASHFHNNQFIENVL